MKTTEEIEQSLFAARQVYPDCRWEFSRTKDMYPISSDKHDDWDPETNDGQRWDMLMWVFNHKKFRCIRKQRIEYWAHDNDISYIYGPLNSETLIKAVCVLGGFDE